MITDIQRAWNGLLGAEKGFEEWLLAELMRLERLGMVSHKMSTIIFDHKHFKQKISLQVLKFFILWALIRVELKCLIW